QIARNDAGRDSTPAAADASAAKSALDRITIPPEVLERIAPNASPRSSLIISDEAMSRETGKGTDFIAVLSNEPQGGLAMRRRSSPSGDYYRTWTRRDDFWGRRDDNWRGPSFFRW